MKISGDNRVGKALIIINGYRNMKIKVDMFHDYL